MPGDYPFNLFLRFPHSGLHCLTGMVDNLLRRKAHKFTLPVQRHRFGLAVAVLRHNALTAVPIRFLAGIVFARVVVLAIEEEHDVGILFDGAGIAQIGEDGTVALCVSRCHAQAGRA